MFKNKTYVSMLASEYNLSRSCSSGQNSVFAENTCKPYLVIT